LAFGVVCSWEKKNPEKTKWHPLILWNCNDRQWKFEMVVSS